MKKTMQEAMEYMTSELYKPDSLSPIITSITLFTLYTLAGLMEINVFMKDIGLGEASVEPAKLTYSVFGGWYTWFLKVCLALITIWALITIIRVSVSGIIEIFGKNNTASGALRGMVRDSTHSMTLWILGVFFLENILVFFLVLAPFTLMILMVPYSYTVYSAKKMRDVEETGSSGQVKSVLNTMHHHIMMIFCIIVFVVIINTTIDYIRRYDKINFP